MMYKVPYKDQYTSGYAQKIAGSYTLVSGFFYTSVDVSVYIMYTAGNMRYTGVAWKVGIRTLTLVVGFLIRHYTCPYFSCGLHEAWSVRIWCGSQVYGFLHSLMVIHRYSSVHLSVFIMYTARSMKCTDIVWRAGIRILTSMAGFSIKILGYVPVYIVTWILYESGGLQNIT